MSSALCSNIYCVLNMRRSLINPLECQVLYPLRSITFAWTSVISVDFHDYRFKAEEVWFKWFWIIQSSSSDQFLLQLLQGIYLILVFLTAIPNLFACYSLIHLDFSIVLSIALELNWSFLGLYCDIKCVASKQFAWPSFHVSELCFRCQFDMFDDLCVYDWAFQNYTNHYGRHP